MADDYKVETEVIVKTGRAVSEARKLAQAIREIERHRAQAQRRATEAVSVFARGFSSLGAMMRPVNFGLGRMVGSLVAMGGTYLGVRAVTGALRDFAAFSMRANSSVETLTLSLGTVMSEVEGMSFEQARREAGGLYRQIQDIAIQSPGTAAEVADVFTMAYGPMRSAGAAMDDILRLSQNTLSVASALRIDLPQVGRDINAMATGVAGTDVRTFRLLRSMGLITESTEQWNRMALEDPAQAAQRLMQIFEQLGGPAAEAFGRTWTGVLSSFRDIIENFSRLMGGSTFSAIRDSLGGINAWLLRYRANIENVMEYLGGRVGDSVQRAIDRIREVGLSIGENMDMIVMRVDDMVSRAHELLPALKAMAKVFVGVSVATRVLAPVLSLIGGVLAAVPALAGLAGTIGVGGAAGAGAAGAAGTAVAGGGFAALLASAGAALSWLIPIVAGVVAAFAQVGAIIYATVTNVGPELWAAFEPIWADIQGAAAGLWELLLAGWAFIEPFLVAIGSIIASMVLPVLAALSGTLHGFGSTALWVAEALRVMAEWVRPPLLAFSRAILGATRSVVNFITSLFRVIGELASSFGIHIPSMHLAGLVAGEAGTAEPSGPTGELWSQLQEAWGRGRTAMQSSISGRGGPPGQRPTTNVDMRGSRIEVRQEFREADPDRVWLQFRDGLAREAIHRTQSGYVSPLSR